MLGISLFSDISVSSIRMDGKYGNFNTLVRSLIKDEFVLLTPATLDPLLEYLEARASIKNQDPLFASHSTKNFGKSLTTRSVSRIVKEALRKMNLDNPRLTAHSLRHTAITLSLLGGATPQEARVMARHADINTTLIYAHNINRIKQAPEKKIDEILD